MLSADAMEAWPFENVDVLVRIGAQRLHLRGGEGEGNGWGGGDTFWNLKCR